MAMSTKVEAGNGVLLSYAIQRSSEAFDNDQVALASQPTPEERRRQRRDAILALRESLSALHAITRQLEATTEAPPKRPVVHFTLGPFLVLDDINEGPKEINVGEGENSEMIDAFLNTAIVCLPATTVESGSVSETASSLQSCPDKTLFTGPVNLNLLVGCTVLNMAFLHHEQGLQLYRSAADTTPQAEAGLRMLNKAAQLYQMSMNIFQMDALNEDNGESEGEGALRSETGCALQAQQKFATLMMVAGWSNQVRIHSLLSRRSDSACSAQLEMSSSSWMHLLPAARYLWNQHESVDSVATNFSSTPLLESLFRQAMLYFVWLQGGNHHLQRQASAAPAA